MADDLKTPPQPHDAGHDEHHDAEPMGRAGFTAFTNATADDWQKIAAANAVFSQDHVKRIVTHLNLLKGDHPAEVKAKAIENLRLFLPTKWSAIAKSDEHSTRLSRMKG